VCEEGFWRSHAAARVDFQYGVLSADLREKILLKGYRQRRPGRLL